MSVNRLLMPIIVITVLLGTVLGSQIIGIWSISGRTSVDMGELSPEDIKGWMTLQQVADGLDLSIEEVYQVGGIPADVSPDSALKDMEDVIEVSALREALADYLSGSETIEPTAEPAADIVPTIEVESTPTSAVTPAATVEAQHTGDGTGPTPLPEGQLLPADQIKGRMTLREVSDQCAVDLDTLLAALNLPPDTGPDTQLKTLIEEGVLDEVTQVQEAVAALQE
ncbi:MAG: hypothetical protein HY866_17065 [Chloroflexi bacterium]|nr:hypothetical protein [Chloroflexota bacterium]